MIDFLELLICLGSGLIILVLMSVFIGNELLYIEVPLLGKVPFGLVIAVAVSLYGCFGLITLGLGKTIYDEFFLTLEIQKIIAVFAVIISYFFGKIMMQMFLETPYKSFCDRAIGLTAKIRYPPQIIPTKKSGDALVLDRQEKITQIITVYLVHWAEEKILNKNDTVWIIDYLPQEKAYLVIKAGGQDELAWQSLQFDS